MLVPPHIPFRSQRSGLAMFDAIRKHVTREHFGFHPRFRLRIRVDQDSCQFGDFGDPAPVLFAIDQSVSFMVGIQSRDRKRT